MYRPLASDSIWMSIDELFVTEFWDLFTSLNIYLENYFQFSITVGHLLHNLWSLVFDVYIAHL